MRKLGALLAGGLLIASPASADWFGNGSGGSGGGGGTITFSFATGGVKMDGGTVLLVDTADVGSVMIGHGAGQNLSLTNAENVFVGNISGQFVTTGSALVAIGQHAMGYETTGTSSIAMGNDSMRNTVGIVNGVALGNRSHEYGRGQANTAVGNLAMSGNSSNITITGSKTTGDVLTLNVTSASMNGGALWSGSYTIQAGDGSLSVVATNFAAAITAAAVGKGDFAASAVGQNIYLQYVGTQTTGYTATLSTGVTGASTEVLTLADGFSGGSNVAVGSSALLGRFATTAANNVAVGVNTLQNATSASQNTAVGTGALGALTTGTSNVAVGNSAGPALTTGVNNVLIGGSTGNVLTGGSNTFVGNGAGVLATSPNNNTILGANVGSKLSTGGSNLIIGSASTASTTLASGVGNIIIGIGSANDTAGASDNNHFIMGGSSATHIFTGSNLDTIPKVVANGMFGMGFTGAITAHAGGGVASATLLTTGISRVDTVATAADSVVLPSLLAENTGITAWVHNNSGNAMQLFASSSGTINGSPAATGISVAAGKIDLCYASSTTSWSCAQLP